MSPAQLLEEAAKPDSDPLKEKDANLLASMLIYHGQFLTNPLLLTVNESWSRKALYIGMKDDEKLRPADREMNSAGDPFGFHDDRGQHWYACRHIQLDGNCGIYETRPEMCRRYPNGRECGFVECTLAKEDQGIVDLDKVVVSAVRLLKKQKAKRKS